LKRRVLEGMGVGEKGVRGEECWRKVLEEEVMRYELQTLCETC